MLSTNEPTAAVEGVYGEAPYSRILIHETESLLLSTTKEALVWASAGTTETILGAIDAGPVAGQASVGESGADAIAAPASRLSAQNRAEGMQGTLGNEVASDVQHLRKLLLLSASSKGSGAPEGKLAVYLPI